MKWPFRFVVLLLFASCVFAQWEAEDSGTKMSLRGIRNAGQGVAWASGASGTVLRSEDDGYMWQQCKAPADSEGLDFRGIWAWGADRAIVMSSGQGDASRLYKTMDGGAHWRLLFTDPDPTGFWDAIAFLNDEDGVLLGDPVNGKFAVFRTRDAGDHWSRDNSAELAADADGEGAFAASNSALAISAGAGEVYFGTGGAGGARIFRSHAGHWTTVRLPWLQRGETTGVFSVAFRDALHGVAVGGDYKQPDHRSDTAAFTSDSGITWIAAADPPSGYRSAVAWNSALRAWIAVGPNGTDISYDDGKSWKALDKTGWNAVNLPWVVGEKGTIAMFKESLVKRQR